MQTQEILDTVKSYTKILRSLPKETRGPHFHMAKRGIADAKLLAGKNDRQATIYIMEARLHLQLSGWTNW